LGKKEDLMTKFIMIRHGFSVANNEKRFSGHSDFPLTDRGRLQAEKCAEALKGEHIDAIYASDLSRAFETALPVAKSHSLTVIPHKGLREIYAGEWEGKSFFELDEKYSKSFDVWKSDIGHVRPDGGESVAELYDRILTTLGEIAAENEGKTVCIATHATPIRAVCAAAECGNVADMSRIAWVPNASISLFEYENGRFTAIYTGRADHLGDLCTTLPANV
jgi:broad specificity phosphatase PhoE